MKSLETSRLLLRRWQPSDVESFVEMNADPEVMEFFPSVLSREATLDMVQAIENRFATSEFGLWAG